MPGVVINDFEVVPASPADEIKAPAKEAKGKGAEKPPTEHEVKQMLERCVERLERVSAH